MNEQNPFDWDAVNTRVAETVSSQPKVFDWDAVATHDAGQYTPPAGVFDWNAVAERSAELDADVAELRRVEEQLREIGSNLPLVMKGIINAGAVWQATLDSVLFGTPDNKSWGEDFEKLQLSGYEGAEMAGKALGWAAKDMRKHYGGALGDVMYQVTMRAPNYAVTAMTGGLGYGMADVGSVAGIDPAKTFVGQLAAVGAEAAAFFSGLKGFANYMPGGYKAPGFLAGSGGLSVVSKQRILLGKGYGYAQSLKLLKTGYPGFGKFAQDMVHRGLTSAFMTEMGQEEFDKARFLKNAGAYAALIGTSKVFVQHVDKVAKATGWAPFMEKLVEKGPVGRGIQKALDGSLGAAARWLFVARADDTFEGIVDAARFAWENGENKEGSFFWRFAVATPGFVAWNIFQESFGGGVFQGVVDSMAPVKTRVADVLAKRVVNRIKAHDVEGRASTVPNMENEWEGLRTAMQEVYQNIRADADKLGITLSKDTLEAADQIEAMFGNAETFRNEMNTKEGLGYKAVQQISKLVAEVDGKQFEMLVQTAEMVDELVDTVLPRIRKSGKLSDEIASHKRSVSKDLDRFYSANKHLLAAADALEDGYATILASLRLLLNPNLSAEELQSALQLAEKAINADTHSAGSSTHMLTASLFSIHHYNEYQNSVLSAAEQAIKGKTKEALSALARAKRLVDQGKAQDTGGIKARRDYRMEHTDEVEEFIAKAAEIMGVDISGIRVAVMHAYEAIERHPNKQYLGFVQGNNLYLVKQSEEDLQYYHGRAKTAMAAYRRSGQPPAHSLHAIESTGTANFADLSEQQLNTLLNNGATAGNRARTAVHELLHIKRTQEGREHVLEKSDLHDPAFYQESYDWAKRVLWETQQVASGRKVVQWQEQHIRRPERTQFWVNGKKLSFFEALDEFQGETGEDAKVTFIVDTNGNKTDQVCMKSADGTKLLLGHFARGVSDKVLGYASEMGVDLDSKVGSGVDGAILLRDIDKWASVQYRNEYSQALRRTKSNRMDSPYRDRIVELQKMGAERKALQKAGKTLPKRLALTETGAKYLLQEVRALRQHSLIARRARVRAQQQNVKGMIITAAKELGLNIGQSAEAAAAGTEKRTSWVRKWLGLSHHNVDSITEMVMGEGGMMEALVFDGLHAALNQQIAAKDADRALLMTVLDRRLQVMGMTLDELQESQLLHEWSSAFPGKTKVLSLQTARGVKVKMTEGNLISFYLTALQPEGFAHLISKKGFRVAVKSEHGAESVRTPATLNGKLTVLTKADVLELANLVGKDPMRLAIAESFAEVMQTRLKDRSNEATMRMLGYRKATVQDYFPLATDPDFVDSKYGEEATPSYFASKNIENPAHLQKRLHSKSPVLLQDAFDAFNQQVVTVSAYQAFAEKLAELHAVLSDGDLQQAMKNTFGTSYVRAMQETLHRVSATATTPDVGIADFAKQLSTNTVSSMLIARPLNWIKQTSSAHLAMTEPFYDEQGNELYLTAADIAKGVGIAVTQAQAIYEMKARHSPMLAQRGKAAKIGRDIGSLTNTDAYSFWFEGKVHWRSKMAVGLQVADTGAIDGIILAVQKRLPGASEAHVMRQAERVILRSQPQWNMLDRGYLAGTPGNVMPLLTVFRSFLDQTTRVAGRNNRRLKRGRISKAQWAKNSLTIGLTVAVPAAIIEKVRQLLMAWLTGNDDKYATVTEEVADTAIKSAIRLTAMQWGLGDATYALYSGIKYGKAYSEPQFAPVSDTIATVFTATVDAYQVGEKLLHDKEPQGSIDSLIENSLTAIGRWKGVPLEYGSRVYRAIREIEQSDKKAGTRIREIRADVQHSKNQSEAERVRNEDLAYKQRRFFGRYGNQNP